MLFLKANKSTSAGRNLSRELRPAMSSMHRRFKTSLMDRLNSGDVVIGDGGFVFTMERRGYMKAYPWTPEVVVEEPSAVAQAHREFMRAGADVMQTFTFFAAEENIDTGGSGGATEGISPASQYGSKAINRKACDICHDVVGNRDVLIAGGVSEIAGDRWEMRHELGLTKDFVQKQIRDQIAIFQERNVDFIIAEYIEQVEEGEWIIEAIKDCSDYAVVTTMAMGPSGDDSGVPCGEVAERLAKAGSEVVGINCHFGPMESLKIMQLMKQGLVDAGLFGKHHLCVQPLVYHTPDCDNKGFIDLPEFPFALEPRVATRAEIQTFTREAYDMGIRYIGGCCGFGAYHVRAMAEELEKERGRLPDASVKHGVPLGSSLGASNRPWVRARASKSYWQNLHPATGRPHSPPTTKPDNGFGLPQIN